MIRAHLYAVVMAGGSGTRFWPASRRLTPKQLLPLVPGSEQSLLAATVRRLETLCAPERILIATGEHLLSAVARELPQLPAENLLGEPLARNTAPCIAWATSIALERDREASVMVLPSDQHVADEQAFFAALERAVEAADRGAITTIGLQPTRPETGYGYIEAGEPVTAGVRAVARFVEKPDRATAEGYLASGSYFWNSGMFFFRAQDMIAALERHLPELSPGLERLAAARDSQPVTREVFESWPSVSVDYGVMEKASGLQVVPASFGWSDLGSWQAAWELGAKDVEGNSGAALFIDARENLYCDLRTEPGPRMAALVGVSGLCVVQTDDALLVIPRERSQDVAQVVARLREQKRIDLL